MAGMKKTGGALIAVIGLLAVENCQTTKTIVARLVTPTPVPSAPAPPATPRPATPPSPTRTPTVAAMPVITASAPSVYDRTPGVLTEEKAPAARPMTTPTPPTPTRKPGVYYEDADFRPAVTWTPIPEKPARRRS